MKMDVKKALQLPALKKAVLIAGHNGLDRVITSVNVMEVPDIIKYIKPSELLITTTYPIKDDKCSQSILIKNLAESGVSALAIVPEFYDDEIPFIMIEQANEYNFPLIQLPEGTSFNDIINPILEEVLNHRAVILKRNIEIQENFIDVLLNNGSLPEICKIISLVNYSTVHIYSKDIKLLASSNTSKQISNLLLDNQNKILSLKESTFTKFTSPVIETNTEYFVKPISLGKDVYAYIVLLNDKLAYPSLEEIDMIEQATPVIALEISRLRDIFEVEQRFRSRIIEDIIDGKINSKHEILSLGELHGWDLSSGFLPVLISVDNFNEISTNIDFEKFHISILRELRYIISNYIKLIDHKSILVDLNTDTLILIPIISNKLDDKFKSEVNNILKQIQNKILESNKITISAGIGHFVENIMLLREEFKKIIQTLECGRRLNGINSLTSFDELGVYRILISHGNKQEMLNFSRDYLSKLVKCDETNNTDYVNTLVVYLKYNDNLREAARELFIHHNTLSYRIDKIGKITGLDLKSSEVRLNLQVALKIYKMIRRDEVLS